MTTASSGPRKVKVIAEIGCNHRGNIEEAFELIRTAARVCKADVAKFQKRNNRELLTEAEYNAPHPVPTNAYGASYGAHREALEFTVDQHRELMKACEAEGIIYSTSVWDLTSAREIASLQPQLIKIPSATNGHYALQNYLCDQYGGEIHVSTGMTRPDEIAALVDFYEKKGRAKDVVVYACTSGYPVPFEDLALLEINKLQELYGDRVKAIGFSGHHLGISADVAALAVGVTGEWRYGKGSFEWIERHFTMDRTYKGTDHAASLEPDGLRRLCRDIAACSKALHYKAADILDIEQVQRDKLKWSVNNHGAQIVQLQA